MEIRDAADALRLLERLGAPARLIRHHELVLEAAELLVVGLGSFAGGFDARTVLIGAALHDAGKILHPHEMAGPGSRHEADGRALLTEHGLGDLARFCTSHASWDEGGLALEDLLVALADKLWKGKRVADLERRVIERLAMVGDVAVWDVFCVADAVFERVADGGVERLSRSSS